MSTLAEWLSEVVVLGGAVMLVWSAWLYRGRHLQFQAVLIAHRVVPLALTRAVAVIWPVIEVGVGLSVLVATGVRFGAGPRAPLDMLSAVVGVIYLGLAGYLAAALARTDGAPCGCFADDRPISSWSIARVLLVAVASGAVVLNLPRG